MGQHYKYTRSPTLYLRNKFTNGSWEKSYKQVFDLCERLYRNNEYLLLKYKISKKRQIKEWREVYGLTISREREMRVRTGFLKNVSIHTLAFVAIYWSIPLLELLSVDYYQEQSKQIASGALDKSQAIREWSRMFSSVERRKAKIKLVEKPVDGSRPELT